MFIQFEIVGQRPDGPPLQAAFKLDLERGRINFPVGPTGSGKKTLLRILTGCQRPDQGLIAVDGHRVPPGRQRHHRDPRPLRERGVQRGYPVAAPDRLRRPGQGPARLAPAGPRPKLLLLDEPFARLAPEQVERLEASLRAWVREEGVPAHISNIGNRPLVRPGELILPMSMGRVQRVFMVPSTVVA